MILRRLGTPPHLRPSACVGCNNCPDLFELEDGDFAVIGRDVSAAMREHLPPGAGCADDERIVRVPRSVLMEAVADLQQRRAAPEAGPPDEAPAAPGFSTGPAMPGVRIGG